MGQKNKVSIVTCFLLTLSLMTLVVPAYAQSAGDACASAKYTSPIWVSSGAGGAGRFLVCNGSTWQLALEFDNSGNVGGTLVVGESSETCGVSTEGGLRYNTTSNSLELCDGSSWDAVSVGACADATPATFNFTDLVNQSTSTLVTSNILQITGLECTVGISVSGSPQLRTCSDSGCSSVVTDWTGSGTIDNSNYIQLRLTSSAAGGDTYSATLSVGTNADVWSATPTGDCTGSPAAGTVCADGTVYAGMSPDGNVKMYVTRCDAGMAWDGSNCTGTRSLLPWNDGNGSYIDVNIGNKITGQANSAALAAADSNSSLAGIQDHVAAVYCDDITQDGQGDWYLPAQDELNVMYGNKDVIANFSTSYLWSSSEYYSGSNAYRQNFTTGEQSVTNVYKSSGYVVRCARHD